MTQTPTSHPQGSDLCVAGKTLRAGPALSEPRCPLSFQAQVTEGPRVSREWKASRHPSLLCPLPDSPWGSPPLTQFTSSEREHNGHLGCQDGGKGEESRGCRTWVGEALSGSPPPGTSPAGQQSKRPGGDTPRDGGPVFQAEAPDSGAPWRTGDGISQPEVSVAQRFPFSLGEETPGKRCLFQSLAVHSVSCSGLQTMETEVHRHSLPS